MAHTDPDNTAIYYESFSWACHQKISRSLCVFKNQKSGFFIGDCTPQLGRYVEYESRTIIRATASDGSVGYKMPVCSRDIGIYGAMLLGIICYPFVKRMEEKKAPAAIYLLISLIPIGIDGTLQLISNIGFVIPFIGSYESSNFIRLITGVIVGFAASFYIMPILQYFFGSDVNAGNKKN